MSQIMMLNSFRLSVCISVLALCGCAHQPDEGVADVSDWRTRGTVSQQDRHSIPDGVLSQYNRIARKALKSLYYGTDKNWQENRITTVLNAVLRHDAVNGDYLASKLMLAFKELQAQSSTDEIEKIQNATQAKPFLEVFRERGIVVNYSYSRERDNFLWRLGDLYTLTADSQKLVNDAYTTARFELQPLRTIDSGRQQPDEQVWMLGNFANPDTAYLNPKDVAHWASIRDINVPEALEAVAVHETTHDIYFQITSNKLDSKPLPHAGAISIKTGFQFYNALEILEFLADAIQVQTSDTAVEIVAHRIIDNRDVTETRPTRGVYNDARFIPHDASAEFILELFRAEEVRLGVTDKRKTIDWLRSRRNVSPRWLKKYYSPYLKVMLTDSFIKTIQARYLSTHADILSLWLAKGKQ